MKKKIYNLILVIIFPAIIFMLILTINGEIYTIEENFDELDLSVWKISDKRLGNTFLNPDNIDVNNGQLQIKLPANLLEGGEISAIPKTQFGKYEVKMKLPDAPSSITGFFLYEPPDYYHEIDIEIFNQPDGKYLLTTYADGNVQNEFSGYLGFDPTADFHMYGFYFQSDQLKFYVDKLMAASFTTGYSNEPMRLMVNAWYPNWLASSPLARMLF
ncbi:glycoside hydrolase family 16 protein [Eubacteriaceae bacterium ES2]|nr:glycoside hydrolase family 16 protein [Eubacteriaceae bacterium ES2]